MGLLGASAAYHPTENSGADDKESFRHGFPYSAFLLLPVPLTDKLSLTGFLGLGIMTHPDNALMHFRELGRYLLKLAPLFEDVVRQGCSEGVFSTERPLEASEFILAATRFLTDMGSYPWDGTDLARRAAAFPALLGAQLRAPKEASTFCCPLSVRFPTLDKTAAEADL